jgi:class 3 adenylate cyclase
MSYPPPSPGGQDMTRTEPQSDVFQCAETLRHRHVAVMFADLDHFTRICIDDPPEFVFGLIRDFQRVVTSAVAEFRGKLNSYQGDGILATFADLAGRADCTTRALKCAQTILEQIEVLSLKHTRMSGRSVSISIGLQYGQTWTGTIDISRRFGPTIIGDAVNVATRLEQRARALDARLVVGDDLIQRARCEAGSTACELSPFVKVGPLFVHGRRTPVDVWKLSEPVSDLCSGMSNPARSTANVAVAGLRALAVANAS